MKKVAVILTLLFISIPCVAQESWLDSLKSMLGLAGDQEKEIAKDALDMSGLLNSVSGIPGVSEQQAKGGLAALMDYVKDTSSPEQFEQLQGALPGLESLLTAVPRVPATQAVGLDALMNKAAELNTSLKHINDLKQQFEALGLNVDKIPEYISQVNRYLDTAEGQAARQIFQNSLSNLKL